MKKIKNIIDVIGFASLAFLLTSLGIFFYGVAYELHKSDPLYSLFLMIFLIGFITGLFWVFFLFIWLYLDDKGY